jgi:hypothetical protein
VSERSKGHDLRASQGGGGRSPYQREPEATREQAIVAQSYRPQGVANYGYAATVDSSLPYCDL